MFKSTTVWACAPVPLPQALLIPCPAACNHTIVPGDTLWDLAAKAGVQVPTILSMNRGVNPHTLFPNDVVSIPCA